MAFWFRRSKLGFDIISSKITAPKPTVSRKFTTTSSRNYRVTKVSSIVDRSSHFRCYHVRNILSVIDTVRLGFELAIYHEMIPYTKRKHFLLISPYLERKFAVQQFEKMKAKFEGKVLPQMHPGCVRITMILKRVIQALKKEDDDDDSEKSGISHLEGLEWQVLLVKIDVADASCLPNGKIVVFTGLLDFFSANEEIATIVCYEVAHVVARHGAERFTKNFWRALRQEILDMFVRPGLNSTSNSFMLDIPFAHRMEIEADYIGLMLMASAGYDPRVAPKVFEKVRDSGLQDKLDTHPSNETRSKLLSEASVMQEAISRYEEAIAGQDVDT